MAGPKKKRKKTQSQFRKVPTNKNGIPNSYIKMYEGIVRKHLRFLGVDPDLYDKLNKKSRMRMLYLKSTLPVFIAKEGYAVPRVYIKYLNQHIAKTLQTNEYGYDNIGYTYEDYYLGGMSFDFNVKYMTQYNLLPPDQLELLRPALEAAQDPRIMEINKQMAIDLRVYIVKLMNAYSQINYRYYCFDADFIEDRHRARFCDCYYIYSQEGDRKVFNIDNISRTAMRVGTVVSSVPTMWINLERGKIHGSRSTELLPVYMQGHALQRMKERMNISAIYRNLSFFYTFFKEKGTDLVCDILGRKMIPVFSPDCFVVGYFAFSIIDNCVVIKSFLPLSSPVTPEGDKLRKALNLEKDDLTYWGMDKLRFYVETDLERIPILKKALEEAGIWHLTKIRSSDSEYDLPAERKANLLLEKFFENYHPEKIMEEAEDSTV